MGRRRLGQASRLDCPLHRPLQKLFIHMMSPFAAAARIDGIAARTEHILPSPLLRHIRIFPRQCVGKPDLRPSGDAVIVIESAAHFQVCGERPYQDLRQHRHPVLGALAVADHRLAPAEIQVLDPEAHAFHQAHAGTIEQAPHQGMRSLHAFKHGGHFGGRKHGRQALRLFRPRHIVQPRQIDAEHLPVKKQQRRERLALGRRRDASIDRQIGKECLHFRPTHLARMSFPVE